MTPKTLKKLNRILSDALGLVPFQYGHQPRYKWTWSPELIFPIRNAQPGFKRSLGGIWLPAESGYREERQIDDDQWVVAMWKEPPTPSEWRREFGTTIPYPGNGRYYATNVMGPVGTEPNEEITHEVAHRFKDAKQKPDNVVLAEWEVARERKEKALDDRADAAIGEHFSDYGLHVRGKRSGDTSFGGIESHPPQ